MIELLGHSTITLTLDTYSHVQPALQAEVVPGHMETLFGTADPGPDGSSGSAAQRLDPE